MVDPCLRIMAEGGVNALMAGVGGHHGKAPVQRIGRRGLRADSRAHDAVIAAATLEEEAVVPPGGRQAQLKADGIGPAVDAATLGHGGIELAMFDQGLVARRAGRAGGAGGHLLGTQAQAGDPGIGHGLASRLCRGTHAGQGQQTQRDKCLEGKFDHDVGFRWFTGSGSSRHR